MIQLHLRLSESLNRRIAQEVRKRRLRSSAAFIRAAVETVLDTSGDEMRESERRIAATLDRIAQEMVRLNSAEQTTMALLDALARVMLHCIPEPPPEVRELALARAKVRHENLLKMVTRSLLQGHSHTLVDLVHRGE